MVHTPVFPTRNTRTSLLLVSEMLRYHQQAFFCVSISGSVHSGFAQATVGIADNSDSQSKSLSQRLLSIWIATNTPGIVFQE
jgi:hypothetical protein